MSKKQNRRATASGRHVRDRRSPKHLAVFDAANVIAHADQLSELGRHAVRDEGRRWIGQVADNVLQEWRKSPVVLRVDAEFVGALLGSDTDVELVPAWTRRMPFDTVAFSLPEPISVHDGTRLCHYSGAIATGVSSSARGQRLWTTYGSFGSNDGVRLLWTFHMDGDPTPQGQKVTVMLSGEFSHRITLARYIEAQRAQLEDIDGEWGDELPTLVPLSVQLLLYLAASEPDLELLAPGSFSRPQQLQSAQVGHVGWRVGAALRRYRAESDAAAEGPVPETVTGPTGWRLPPHIRKAHWHRVRVATRDEFGAIVGDRSGEQGVDWECQMRWYPPTPVNVADGGSPDPVVRSVADSEDRDDDEGTVLTGLE